MPTVAEYLKAQGIAEEVAAGLPADVAKALTGYMGDADSKLTAARDASTKAEEARRQSELERKEVSETDVRQAAQSFNNVIQQVELVIRAVKPAGRTSPASGQAA